MLRAFMVITSHNTAQLLSHLIENGEVSLGLLEKYISAMLKAEKFSNHGVVRKVFLRPEDGGTS